jgi:import inner membrane translocase subunit TIM44
LTVIALSAGASVVVHKLSARQQAWEDMKSTNPVLKKFSELKQAYDESENSFVSGLRTVTDTIGSWFDENETAQVLRTMKNMDPDFNRESFERELREYIVPEVVDAYLECGSRGIEGVVWRSCKSTFSDLTSGSRG